MKYIRQFAVILGFTCAGEILHYFIPLPIPGSVYGLVLLFAFLAFGWIKLEDVRETGQFLIEIMPLMFIPAAAGLVDVWPDLKPIVWPVVITVLATTVLVMTVTGQVTQRVIRAGKEKQH